MRPETLAVEVTYLPSRLGAHLWHDFREPAVRADLYALRRLGFQTVRVHLGWDAFMPTDRGVSRRRLGEFEALLRIAAETDMRVVPVLFAQSFGDVILLPAYTVLRNREARGVRVMADGVLQPGGPRQIWSDPLMLEIAVVWADAMIAAFAGHPIVAEWDLGHDPATTVRPERTAAMVAWVAALASRFREQGDSCRITLGVGDILTARGVRPAELAALLDRIDIAVMPQRLRFSQKWPEVEETIFVGHLAQALTGGLPTGLVLTVASGDAVRSPSTVRDPGIASAADARTYGARVVGALRDAGVVSVGIWGSHSAATQLATAPPCDRMPGLAATGVIDSGGATTGWGDAIAGYASATMATAKAQPLPGDFESNGYYSNLPDASKDLFTSWGSDQKDHPAIVS